MDWMQREDQASQHSSWNRQPPEDDHEEPCRRGMQTDIEKVVPQRVVAPQSELQPEQ